MQILLSVLIVVIAVVTFGRLGGLLSAAQEPFTQHLGPGERYRVECAGEWGETTLTKHDVMLECLSAPVALSSAQLPVDAVYTDWSPWTPTGEMGACQDGRQLREEERLRTLMRPAQHGGATGEARETRSVSETC